MTSENKCKWTKDEETEVYYTSCDEAQYFETDNRVDNKYKYCPYCGKAIVEIKS